MQMDRLSPNSPRRTASVEFFRLEPLSRLLTVSNDGYDYTDAGVAPEDAPTTGRQPSRPQGPETPVGDTTQLVPSRRAPDDNLRLWTRWIEGGWRPKVPDEESAIPEPLPATPGDAPASAKTQSVVHHAKTRDFEIMHNWTQSAGQDESAFHLNVVHRPAVKAQTATSRERPSIEGHIRWVHSEESIMTTANFEDLISRFAFKHVDSGVRDLTRRLLKRVWATDEREFVGGRFLNAATTRYDGQSKNDDEKPCTFFNFPYFSVERPKPKMDNNVEPPGPKLEHPVRALLQSRYRLEATEARDQDQSITKLSHSEVRTCIRSSPNRDMDNMENKSRPIIHVPQLWCLSLSGDVMVTSGPISESALRGSVVMTKDTNVQVPQAGHGPPLVRIILEHSGKQQPFLYPKDQCDWWFGLLNKQRQILRSLGDENATEVKFGQYKFYTTSEANNESLVDIHNWHDTLKKEKSERLDLWIKNTVVVPGLTLTTDTGDGEMNDKGTIKAPETRSDAEVLPTTPEISMTGSNPSVPIITQPQAPSQSTSPRTSAATNSETAAERTDASYILSGAAVQPFFEWPFLNDEGNLDKRSPEDKVMLWLRRISGALKDKYGTMLDKVQAGNVQIQGHSHEATVTIGQRKVSPCSSADAYARLLRPETRKSKHITEMRRLCVESEQLFRLFVPIKSSPASSRTSRSPSSMSQPKAKNIEATHETNATEPEAVGIYWGAVDTIVSCLSQHENPQFEIEELVQGLRQIISAAKELHLGMRSLRSVHADRHDSPDQSDNTEIRLLLEVIVDAFEAIYGVLFGAVKNLGPQAVVPHASRNRISGLMGSQVKESCRLLKIAKDRLIVEADEINHDKGLGPVVTPEAIIIMLLERLSRGVYQNATIDIKDLYEKIVEKIALKVEHSASKRLLLEINRVSEELDIINDVLTQQKSVLTPFRESLNPATFKTTSIPRKMKFQYESKSIDKILKLINESIIDCAELRQRASRLAIQNVQLVETKLEDNGKAIIVFTVVTIFFLPLSFVTGFFGMNLEGITGTTSSVVHFWVIALPLTFGIVFLCLFAAFLGSIKRLIQQSARQRKEKNA